MNVAKIKILLYLAFALLTSNCFGQEEDLNIAFPDTIHFSNLVKRTVLNLDSAKIQILDTIENPDCYIARNYPEPYQPCISILVRQKDSWDLYEVVQNSGDKINFEQIDFNGKGEKELVIYYYKSSGLSWWTHGWAEHQKGFGIIDLDKFTLLANIENYTSHTDWFQEFAPDESDTLEYSERTLVSSGGNKSGSNYAVSISKGKLMLTESSACDDFGENIINDFTKPRVIIYLLGKNYLIKKATK